MTALVDPLDADRQVSLEKMRASGLDVGFFVVSGGQPAEGRNGGDVPRTEVSVELGHEDFERRFSPANRSDFVDHMDYIVGLIGIDHVGFSSDFGGGGGVDGLEDASETFDVTLELTCPGYSEGGNLSACGAKSNGLCSRARRVTRLLWPR